MERYHRWLTCVDIVSETTRNTWDHCFEMNIYEFFNIMSYRKQKDEKLQAQIKKWKRTH